MLALINGGNLITGVDEELRRVYVGLRSDCIYFDEPLEAVNEAIAHWRRTSQHLVISRNNLSMLELKHEYCRRCGEYTAVEWGNCRACLQTMSYVTSDRMITRASPTYRRDVISSQIT